MIARVNAEEKVEKGKKPVDFRVFFIIGVSFIGSGSALAITVGFPLGIALIGAGVCFMAIGLANRDKWV